MAHPLDGCRAKIARAKEHADHLQREVDPFVSSRTYKATLTYQDEGEWYRGDFAIAHRPPIRWATMVGDAVHNMRSALDHLVWQLVEVNKGFPGKRTEFPIFHWEDAYKKDAPKKIKGVAPPAAAIIEGLQPFKKGLRFEEDPLYVVHALDIQDKHQLLNPVVAAMRKPKIEVVSGMERRELESADITDYLPDFLEEGTPMIAALPGFAIEGGQPETTVEVTYPLDVRFDRIGPADGRPLVPYLRELIGYVEHGVVDKFVSFFE